MASVLARNAVASSSRLRPSAALNTLRCISSSSCRLDVGSEASKSRESPRELIERQRKLFEAKYGDKLKQKVEAEGVRDLDALKAKVLAPSVKALKAKRKASEYMDTKAATDQESSSQATTRESVRAESPRKEQAQGDRAGIKPLSSILNLDLLNSTPHTAEDISKIWTAYHTAHPTLAASFLSAFLPTTTYNSMMLLAKENPFFVLPLPKQASNDAESSGTGQIKTDEYEMFYLQWLFHPTPSASVQPTPSADGKLISAPMTSSVIFTPLEEFKKQGEWAQPFLVLTHYPELANSHNIVLMRGEISTSSNTGPQGDPSNPGYLLSQSQAQLLALALQRFYCADLEPLGEASLAKTDRLNRAQTLKDFREKPGQWDWQGLVNMAYGGLV